MNPCLLQEELGMGGDCLEEENGALYMTPFEDFKPLDSLLPSLEDKMPFLQMLQGVESHHPHYQQHIQNPFYLIMQQPMLMKPSDESTIPSCVTNNNDIFMDLQSSPIAPPHISTMDHSNVENSTPKSSTTSCKGKKNQMVGPTKEKKKRKRTTAKPSKNKEEVETQRMTHIAVERNRRRQMNQHLNVLRSLMPPSYVQRGDQASIVGGAIDFVKELEQVLQSLEGQKRMRQYENEKGDVSASSGTSSPPWNMLTVISAMQRIFPHDKAYEEGGKLKQELRAENRSGVADIQVMVIQNHVNLKIRCQRRRGQLLNAILALEQLSFTVLHLNITSMHSFVYYSFNLKIEEECKVGSADEVASVVHQIFRLINSS